MRFNERRDQSARLVFGRGGRGGERGQSSRLTFVNLSSCSVDDDLRVQITDNALARDLFPQDYHCLGDNENRPIKWLAVESLLSKAFTPASDVVSNTRVTECKRNERTLRSFVRKSTRGSATRESFQSARRVQCKCPYVPAV